MKKVGSGDSEISDFLKPSVRIPWLAQGVYAHGIDPGITGGNPTLEDFRKLNA